MSISNYTQEKKYYLKGLDNYIYLYPFKTPISEHITDDGISNAISLSLNNIGYSLYCENVTYNETTSINDRFSFENSLTVTLLETNEKTNHSILNNILNNEWMVLFKNIDNDYFILNGEYPIDVTYQYNINDENSPNSLAITFKSLSNLPILSYQGILNYNIMREKPCGYNIGKIKSLKIVETSNASIGIDNNTFTIYENGDAIKTIEFNKNSLSFTDSFDGSLFTHSLSFDIPFDDNLWYFHYNLLEYNDNRYYATIETTNNNNILCGLNLGLFPSYSIQDDVIRITLSCSDTTHSVIYTDTFYITENTQKFYRGVKGECINGQYTLTLIEELDKYGYGTNSYYCLMGYEYYYSDYVILGTYDKYDTRFGIKLTNPLMDCSVTCYVRNIPSSIKLYNINETQCFFIDTNCSLFFEYDTSKIRFEFDEITNEACITSLVEDGIVQIKVTTSDGVVKYIKVLIGSYVDEADESLRIFRWKDNDETICMDESQNIDCIRTETVQYDPNNNKTFVQEGENRYYRINEYISQLCDGNYTFIGFIKGDLINDNRIYRWVLSDNTNDYYCDTKTYTKYAIEVQEYSDNNGSTWIRTDSTRQSSTVLETNSEDCGYNSGNTSGGTNTMYRWVVSYNESDYYCDYNTYTKYAMEYEEYSDNNGLTWARTGNERLSSIILETNSEDCGYNSGNTSGDTNTMYRWVVSYNESDYYCDYNTYTKYAMEYEEYSVDNGLTWIRTGNERQSSIILETNSEDCGYSSGNTECDNETIAFSWSGTATSFKLDINETEYTATTNPYSATLTELGIDKFTSAKEMFMNIEHTTIAQITTITSIPCTNNVTDMSFMFYYCGGLTSLDLSHFDTSNVTDMTYMFGSCNSLTSLDVTHFNTSNVTNMTYMFMACDSLTSLDVTHFNTSNVTSMYGMFHHCIGLTSLDLSNFNTSKVTNMCGMFGSCPNLRILDLSNWDISNVTDVSAMFRYCKPLTIKVTNCNDITISKLQEAIDDSGFTSTVANGIIKVNYKS